MRRYLIFSAVCVILLTASISGTAVSVAFPQIISSFNVSLILAGWVLGANMLASTAAMPLAGKFCDSYGSKFTFIFCICLFTVGSLLCSLARNIEMLIIFRLIQGVGMGGFLPSGTSIIAREFPNSRQQAIGFMSAVFSVGPIIGPNLGAWLTTSFGWNSTFWVFVPFGVIALIIALFLVPRTQGSSSKLDLPGAGLLTAILSALMLGISLMGNSQNGVPWLAVGLLLTLAVVFSIVFMRRQARVKNPIVDVEVLKEKRFLAANVYNMIVGFGLFGITNFVPFYAVSIFGMSTYESGFVMTPRSIGVLVTSVLSSMLLLKLGYRKPMIFGTVLSALTLMIMGFISPGSLSAWQISGFWLLSVVLLFNGIGLGAANPAANNACIELMPDKIGTITGIRGMFRFIGAAVGISLATLVLNNSSSLSHGFFLVIVGTAIILLLSVPVILIIPKSANVAPIRKEARET